MLFASGRNLSPLFARYGVVRAKMFLLRAAFNLAATGLCWEAEEVDLDPDIQNTELNPSINTLTAGAQHKDLHFPKANCSVTFSDKDVLTPPIAKVLPAVDLQFLLPKGVKLKAIHYFYNISLTLASLAPGMTCCLFLISC